MTTTKPARVAKPAAPAPQSGPTSNPPGGGRWKWDDATQKWVSLNQPATTKTQE